MKKLFVRGLVGCRNGFSRLLNWRRKTVEWRPVVASIKDFEGWMKKHFEYSHDPFGGLFDNTKSVGHMFWEYHTKGKIQGDCDDSATLYAWALWTLKRADQPIGRIWRVNIPSYLHVIGVWENVEDVYTYYYSSGKYIYTGGEKGWSNIQTAIDAYGQRHGEKKRGVCFYAEPVENIRF